MTDSLYRLAKADAGAATAVLSRAFRDYPMITYYFPEEESRGKMLSSFLAAAVYSCLKHGEVHATSSRLEGIAGWLPPGKAPLGGWEFLFSIPLRVLVSFAFNGGGRMRDMADYVDSMHRKMVPFPHWYLQVIGVAPEFQGKGLSGRLIRPMLERLDREGTPCFLETQKEKNAEIYEHFGFQVLYREKVPGTPLTSWGMLRKAGKPESEFQDDGRPCTTE